MVSTYSGGSCHASLNRLRRWVYLVSRKSGPYQDFQACNPAALDGVPTGATRSMALFCSGFSRLPRDNQIARLAAIIWVAVTRGAGVPAGCLALLAMIGAFSASDSTCS